MTSAVLDYYRAVSQYLGGVVRELASDSSNLIEIVMDGLAEIRTMVNVLHVRASADCELFCRHERN